MELLKYIQVQQTNVILFHHHPHTPSHLWEFPERSEHCPWTVSDFTSRTFLFAQNFVDHFISTHIAQPSPRRYPKRAPADGCEVEEACQREVGPRTRRRRSETGASRRSRTGWSRCSSENTRTRSPSMTSRDGSSCPSRDGTSGTSGSPRWVTWRGSCRALRTSSDDVAAVLKGMASHKYWDPSSAGVSRYVMSNF